MFSPLTNNAFEKGLTRKKNTKRGKGSRLAPRRGMRETDIWEKTLSWRRQNRQFFNSARDPGKAVFYGEPFASIVPRRSAHPVERKYTETRRAKGLPSTSIPIEGRKKTVSLPAKRRAGDREGRIGLKGLFSEEGGAPTTSAPEKAPSPLRQRADSLSRPLRSTGAVTLR